MIPHQILDHCWVCGVRFNTANPPGPATEERHHVIPVAAGGRDGPLFSLCSDHHNKLHRIAEILPKRNFLGWLAGETPETTQKVMWLAWQAFNAFQEADSDPNKHVMTALQLDPQLRMKVDALKQVIGVRGRAAVLRYAVEALYARHFTK